METEFFTCYECERTIPKIWSDREAEREMEMLWGDIPVEDRVVVCDDCFTKLVVVQGD